MIDTDVLLESVDDWPDQFVLITGNESFERMSDEHELEVGLESPSNACWVELAQLNEVVGLQPIVNVVLGQFVEPCGVQLAGHHQQDPFPIGARHLANSANNTRNSIIRL